VATTSTSARVKVLFFGRLREIAGSGEEVVEVRAGTSIEELFAELAARKPELNKFRPSLVASRNQEFAAWADGLSADDEVAFLPPVSGG
jgi:molybdopterin converting factor subunit 1